MTGEGISHNSGAKSLQSVAQIDFLVKVLSETLPTGVARGVGLTTEELREMIQSYYQARQWDENGLIPEPKLRELGIPIAPRGGKQCQVMKPAGC